MLLSRRGRLLVVHEPVHEVVACNELFEVVEHAAVALQEEEGRAQGVVALLCDVVALHLGRVVARAIAHVSFLQVLACEAAEHGPRERVAEEEAHKRLFGGERVIFFARGVLEAAGSEQVDIDSAVFEGGADDAEGVVHDRRNFLRDVEVAVDAGAVALLPHFGELENPLDGDLFVLDLDEKVLLRGEVELELLEEELLHVCGVNEVSDGVLVGVADPDVGNDVALAVAGLDPGEARDAEGDLHVDVAHMVWGRLCVVLERFVVLHCRVAGAEHAFVNKKEGRRLYIQRNVARATDKLESELKRYLQCERRGILCVRRDCDTLVFRNCVQFELEELDRLSCRFPGVRVHVCDDTHAKVGFLLIMTYEPRTPMLMSADFMHLLCSLCAVYAAKIALAVQNSAGAYL